MPTVSRANGDRIWRVDARFGFLWGFLLLLGTGFLAAGLTWSLFAPEIYSLAIARFFFGCVLVAGLYGGATAKKSILFVQALPATIALVLTFL